MAIIRHAESLHLTPPSGRGYWLTTDVKLAEVCSTCKGEGHWDSCFDCGNRGYNIILCTGEYLT